MNTKIMIIDAHPVYVHKTVGFLESLTLKDIEVVSLGTKAIEAILRFNPTIIILSAMLPDIDSKKLVEQIKAQKTNIPMIIQTGLLTTPEMIDQFKALGVEHVLPRVEKNWTPFQEAINDIICLKSNK